MLKFISTSFRALAVFTLICGVVYPVFVTVVGQLLFPTQAAGSIAKLESGTPIGSSLLAQKTTSPLYFWPRPSAVDFATVASGASNLSPTSKVFIDQVNVRAKSLNSIINNVPADLLTTSASGIDPHISQEAALFQAARVALARSVPLIEIQNLLQSMVVPADPFFKQNNRKIVNVLELNLALDRKVKKP